MTHKNTGDKPEIIEGEAVEKAVVAVPDRQAVMATPKQLQAQMKRDEEIRAIINQYIKNNMVDGKDYGSITIGGKESKPSLFKPGAEKFCGLFKIRPTFRKDNETLEMLGNTSGIIAYICELVDTQGRVIGEGRGTARTNPETGSDFEINKQVKIAEKRAQIDAVLRTGGLSDFFTQDMEDAPRDTQPASTSASYESSPPRADIPATQKQVDLIGKLSKERFEQPQEFDGFAFDKVGTADNFTLKQASTLISELFKLPKLEGDEDSGY